MAQASEVAQSDPTVGVEAVAPDAVLNGWHGQRGSCLESGLKRLQGCAPVDRTMRAVLVVVGSEGIQLGLEDRDEGAGGCLPRNRFWV